MQHKSREELAKKFHVTAQLTAKWDGIEYDLSKGVNIEYGVIDHWQSMYPNVQFDTSEIAETPISSREIANPFGDQGHQEAFAGLKKRGKQQGG